MKFSIVALALIGSLASPSYASFKSCNFHLGTIDTVLLRQDQATELRGFSTGSLAYILNELKPHNESKAQWVILGVRNSNVGSPDFGKTQHLHMQVVRLEKRKNPARQYREEVVVVGTIRQTTVLPSKLIQEKNISPDIHQEVPLDDIISIQLVEIPQIQIPLLRLYKPSGRVRLIYSINLEEKIATMAEGNREAYVALSKMMGIKLQIDGREIGFDQILEALDRYNIRGLQIDMAFNNYARGDVRRLARGLFTEPKKIVDYINESVPQKYSPVARVPNRS